MRTLFLVISFLLFIPAAFATVTEDLEQAYQITGTDPANSSKEIVQKIDRLRSDVAKQALETADLTTSRDLQLKQEKLNFLESILGNPKNKTLLDEWLSAKNPYRGTLGALPKFELAKPSRVKQFIGRCKRQLIVGGAVLVGVATLPITTRAGEYLYARHHLNSLEEESADLAKQNIEALEKLDNLTVRIAELEAIVKKTKHLSLSKILVN